MSKPELAVTGYACKIFNDKNAAAEIETSAHLHPHELDLLTTIDRFDVRGLLEFPIDYKRATEKRIGDVISVDETEMLRRDRFGDLDSQLDHDDEYRKLQEEIAAEDKEESQKSNGKYGSVGFSYDESDTNNHFLKPEEPQGKAFVVPEGLTLPKNMPLPKLETEHEIILRTAKFLANQNNQMEILLKAKQSGNEKFNFLNFGHVLNDYYKHIKKLISTGEFDPDASKTPPSDSESDSGSDCEGGLLALNAAAARAASKKKNPVQETSERSASPVVNTVDENHPLFKIISQRKEAERRAQIEREARAKQKEIQNKFKSMVQVPPPNICQTVEWVTKELVATDPAEREEKETRLRMQVTLEFMNKGHPFYNYFQTMLQRALLTASRPPSPPVSIDTSSKENNDSKESDHQPIKFEIKTAPTMEARVEAARKKAEEVAKIIVSREMEKISKKENGEVPIDKSNGDNSNSNTVDGAKNESAQSLMPKRRRRSRSRSSSRHKKRSRSRSASRGKRRRRSRSRSRSYGRSHRSRSRSRSRDRHRRRRRKEYRDLRSRSRSRSTSN